MANTHVPKPTIPHAEWFHMQGAISTVCASCMHGKQWACYEDRIINLIICIDNDHVFINPIPKCASFAITSTQYTMIDDQAKATMRDFCKRITTMYVAGAYQKCNHSPSRVGSRSMQPTPQRAFSASQAHTGDGQTHNPHIYILISRWPIALRTKRQSHAVRLRPPKHNGHGFTHGPRIIIFP